MIPRSSWSTIRTMPPPVMARRRHHPRQGIVNNKLSNALMQKLEKEGIPTHYVEEVNDRDTFVKKVEIVPLEVIVRNVAAGHFSLRMGVPEGKVFKTPILEYSYKNDDLHDPFINTTTPWLLIWPPRRSWTPLPSTPSRSTKC